MPSPQRATSGGGSLNASPLSPPHVTVGDVTGNHIGRLASYHRFSVTTCLELLDVNVLTPSQLRREGDILSAMGMDKIYSRDSDINFIRECLENDTSHI